VFRQTERTRIQSLDIDAAEIFGHAQDHEQDAARDEAALGSAFSDIGKRKQQCRKMRHPLSFIASPVAAHAGLRCGVHYRARLQLWDRIGRKNA